MGGKQDPRGDCLSGTLQIRDRAVARWVQQIGNPIYVSFVRMIHGNDMPGRETAC